MILRKALGSLRWGGRGVGLTEVVHDFVPHVGVPRLKPSGERGGLEALLDGADGDVGAAGGVGRNVVRGCVDTKQHYAHVT